MASLSNPLILPLGSFDVEHGMESHGRNLGFLLNNDQTVTRVRLCCVDFSGSMDAFREPLRKAIAAVCLAQEDSATTLFAIIVFRGISHTSLYMQVGGVDFAELEKLNLKPHGETFLWQPLRDVFVFLAKVISSHRRSPIVVDALVVTDGEDNLSDPPYCGSCGINVVLRDLSAHGWQFVSSPDEPLQENALGRIFLCVVALGQHDDTQKLLRACCDAQSIAYVHCPDAENADSVVPSAWLFPIRTRGRAPALPAQQYHLLKEEVHRKAVEIHLADDQFSGRILRDKLTQCAPSDEIYSVLRTHLLLALLETGRMVSSYQLPKPPHHANSRKFYSNPFNSIVHWLWQRGIVAKYVGGTIVETASPDSPSKGRKTASPSSSPRSAISKTTSGKKASSNKKAKGSDKNTAHPSYRLLEKDECKCPERVELFRQVVASLPEHRPSHYPESDQTKLDEAKLALLESFRALLRSADQQQFERLHRLISAEQSVPSPPTTP